MGIRLSHRNVYCHWLQMVSRPTGEHATGCSPGGLRRVEE